MPYKDPEKRRAYSRRWARENYAQHQDWRAKNPDKVKGHHKREYVKHKEKRLTASKRWRDSNRERSNELARQRHSRNPEAARATRRKYYYSHLDIERERARNYAANKASSERELTEMEMLFTVAKAISNAATHTPPNGPR